MNRIILQLLAVTFCFAVVQTLRCYKCSFGVGSVCLTTETECGAGELCFSGKGKAGNLLPITLKGCLKEASCNKTTEESFPSISNTTLYSMTKTCCSSNLCNAAPGLPGASGLGLILASVSALLVANVVV